MPRLSNQTLRKAIHILIFGLPKTGKTELTGELAEHGFRLWYFDLENGSLTLSRSLSKEAQERVFVYQIPDTKDFPIGIETMLKVIKPGKYDICLKHGKVSCALCKKDNKEFDVYDNTNFDEKDIFVTDSITQLSNSAMNNIGIKMDDTWKPEWEHYRSQGSMLDRFFSTIQNAPYHVICITHEGVLEQNNGAEKIVPLAGTRQFSRNTAKYFDEVVYCELKNGSHRAASSTTYSLNILTGSRSRTAVEDQVKPNAPKDSPAPHLSLLPIFINQSVPGVIQAENILQAVKTNIGAAK